jgi:hypothetical protein
VIDPPVDPCEVTGIPSIVAPKSEALPSVTTPAAVTSGEPGVEDDASGPDPPATEPDTALVVAARSPDTSSISTAPEFTATVPSPTPVVAVMPRRRREP